MASPPPRALVLATCTAVTFLYSMSLTAVNVSLPQIQGALSATQDQIAWVITSNLVATAVMTPLTGWLPPRFGPRALRRAPAVPCVRRRLRRRLRRLRPGRLDRGAGSVAHVAGRRGRAAGADVAGDHAGELSARAPRRRDLDLRRRLGARPGGRAGARRRARRGLRLALGVLHDGAVQPGGARRVLALHPRPRGAAAGTPGLDRLPHALGGAGGAGAP